MSDIAKSMKKKGYTALHADNMGGIGFKRSISKNNEKELAVPVWFDTGLKMKGKNDKGEDINVSRIIAAYDSTQHAEFLRKGWKPVEEQKKRKK